MIGNKLEPGDHLFFTQKDGNRILICVGEDLLIIKADNIGTELKTTRCSDIAIQASAVERER